MAASVLQVHSAGLLNGTTTVTMGAYTAGSRLVAYSYGRGSGTISRSGWNNPTGDLTINGTSDRTSSLWRASAGESTSLVFTSSAGSGGRVAVIEIGGVGDLLQYSNPPSNAFSVGHNSLALTGCTAGSLVVGMATGISADAYAGGGWTQPSGWAEQEDGASGGHSYGTMGTKVSSGGSETYDPLHGNDWTGWSPNGETIVIFEFPVPVFVGSQAVIL